VDVERLGGSVVLRGRDVDSTSARERARQRRLARLAVALGLLATWLWFRALSGNPVGWGLPRPPAGRSDLVISFGLTAVLALVIAVPLLAAGRSPHVVLRPADTGIRLTDVVGAEATKREAIDTLNLFLAHRTFAQEMGGQPRRGVLFEGPPGTGKTHLAKAMSGEAGVPFLFVSASAFQSMYYGQTNRKIRSYFRALRKAAGQEGGAIGFIEEFDAIGAARSSMGAGTAREGVTGVVNELLVQMQSFDLPSGSRRFVARLVDFLNLLLPADRHVPRPTARPANVLLVAATNRAADLDPALLRPGRFDRIIHFGLPGHSSRAAIAVHYLARKRHDPELTATLVADVTSGYSPAAIERLLDEALVCALRQERLEMTWSDVLEAKLVTELGLSAAVAYAPDERRRIATHEAGHALVAELVGRRVTIASILQRSEALGLVAHTDQEERNVHTPTEARAILRIMLAGRAAEELEFGEASSGVAADLEAATTLAARVVGALGAGGSLVSFEAASMPVAGNLVAKVLADARARDALEAMLERASDEARLLVAGHVDELRALAKALDERDEITGDEVRQILCTVPAEYDREPSWGPVPSGGSANRLGPVTT
jgi:cell division protease FtsH